MRVRVKFRYRADTGEVEVFTVEDADAAPEDADHDARHDRAAADVARVVEANALVTEVLPGAQPLPETELRPGTANSTGQVREPDTGTDRREPTRD